LAGRKPGAVTWRTLSKRAALAVGYQISRYETSLDAYGQLRRLIGDIAAPVVFDVGAYHGHVATDFRRLIPDSNVYAFEPFPESYARLVANVFRDPRIRTFNFALAESDGERVMQSNLLPATNSLLETDDEAFAVWGRGRLDTIDKLTVETRTLDRVLSDLDLERVDILKLDVQGSEHLVLAGAQRAIAERRISVIYTEMFTAPSYVGQLQFHDSLKMFHDLGMVLHGIYNPGVNDGRLSQVDAIFKW
jgi:FkbM family methyltransferase